MGLEKWTSLGLIIPSTKNKEHLVEVFDYITPKIEEKYSIEYPPSSLHIPHPALYRVIQKMLFNSMDEVDLFVYDLINTHASIHFEDIFCNPPQDLEAMWIADYCDDYIRKNRPKLTKEVLEESDVNLIDVEISDTVDSLGNKRVDVILKVSGDQVLLSKDMLELLLQEVESAEANGIMNYIDEAE